MLACILLLCHAEIRFPADARVVDVTQAPYHARADGKTDATRAIQQALNDHPNAGAIIYLPPGRFLISQRLDWPKGDRGGLEHKNTILQGAGRDQTTLVLADACPGFTDAKKPRALLWTGQKPAQRFRNAVRDLTLDTGKENPGAIGAQFMANNQGVFRDVILRGNGPIGLDLGYSDENGPCLIKNVRVEGFEVGIRTAFAVDSLTFEDIELIGSRVGLRNNGQVVSVRRLAYRGPGVAIQNGKAPSLLTLLESKLACTAKGETAIENAGGLVARQVETTGYTRAVNAEMVKGTTIDEYASHRTPTLFARETRTLRLPIEETPELPWDALEQWTGPFQHGLKPEQVERPAKAGPRWAPADATKAIQAAIDSGKTTVYLPRGEWRISDTILLRGKVRRLIGCEARLSTTKEFQATGKPLFRLADGDAETVVIERMRNTYGPSPAVFVEHASKRTLVLRNLITFGEKSYRIDPKTAAGAGAGKLFLEDVCGGHFEFGKQSVWARQLNVENSGTHVLNDGGTLWVLGYKTERGGTLLHTRKGGQSEILGAFAYSTSGPKPEPMLLTEDGRVSVILRETCFNKNPFQIAAQETKAGETKKLLPEKLPRWTNGVLLGLYTAE